MRVVTNVHSAAPVGGVELHVSQTTRELARRGHAISLMYVESGTLVGEYESYCASVKQVRSVDYWFPPGRRGKLKEAVHLMPAVAHTARRRPEVIYANRVFACGWAIPAGRLARSPVVCHLHGHSELVGDRVAVLNRHVDSFVVISEFVRDLWIGSGIDPEKLSVVYNGIAPDNYPLGDAGDQLRAREALGIHPDAFVATYLGRLDEEKGVHVLAEAWRTLGIPRDEGCLLVVGSSTVDRDPASYRRRLDSLVADAADVRFLPARQDVVTPLHAADVAVVPSTWDEPFGRTVIEGLATGRPVIASRVGGIPEILRGPLDRLLVPGGDVDALAAKILELRGWQEREPALGRVCADRVSEEFTLARMVDGVERAFANVRSG